MKIAILGTGNIGGTLGKKWAAAGFEVIFGTRDPKADKVLSLLDEVGKGARAASTDVAIAAGDIVLFAIPWGVVAVTAKANAAALRGKILIDATNNFAGPVINNLKAFSDHVPGAQYFRAFNSLGWEVFAEPVYGDVHADMFYCGPDGESRTIVEKLISEVGVRPVWAGENDVVHLVDGMGAMWVNLLFRRGWLRGFMFKIIERKN